MNVSGLHAGIFLVSLIFVIDWELERFNLKGAGAPLFILLTGSLGALSAMSYRRIAYLWRVPEGNMIGMQCLAMAAVLIFPMLWLPRRLIGDRRSGWLWIIGLSFSATAMFAYTIIHGN